ncbi:hypothetical protein [Tsukamurella tyrosinosolvens]|uniref:hypothetical protein n=1 Tax=Tsukamurella tyrosinosolvens TaxID=57704 RepID=UPI002DD43344|nr:hypothetical protein [Tsukamurella tyrosinosolvens]MEC4614574.1 hypothetical protein [Tsukamurella tyrosinosolvens]
MTEIVDRDVELAILAQLRERVVQPGLGIEALTRLSNEIRQREKLLRADLPEPKPEAVTVDAAREAFVKAFGPIDPDLFVKVRQEAIEGRLERGNGRARAGVRWPAVWWEKHGATPAALVAYRRAARRMGHLIGYER